MNLLWGVGLQRSCIVRSERDSLASGGVLRGETILEIGGIAFSSISSIESTLSAWAFRLVEGCSTNDFLSIPSVQSLAATVCST